MPGKWDCEDRGVPNAELEGCSGYLGGDVSGKRCYRGMIKHHSSWQVDGKCCADSVPELNSAERVQPGLRSRSANNKPVQWNVPLMAFMSDQQAISAEAHESSCKSPLWPRYRYFPGVVEQRRQGWCHLHKRLFRGHYGSNDLR